MTGWSRNHECAAGIGGRADTRNRDPQSHGARLRDVLLQFLAESVTITGSGSLLGVALGLAGAFSVTAIMRAQNPCDDLRGVHVGDRVVAVGAAVVVGIAFGMYPALRAARLSPIEAIRHE